MAVTLSFVLALFVTTVLLPICRRYAPQMGLMDGSDAERKVHTSSIPRSGGIAIVCGAVVGALLWMPPDVYYPPSHGVHGRHRKPVSRLYRSRAGPPHHAAGDDTAQPHGAGADFRLAHSRHAGGHGGAAAQKTPVVQGRRQPPAPSAAAAGIQALRGGRHPLRAAGRHRHPRLRWSTTGFNSAVGR